MELKLRERTLAFGERPIVMGILNVTLDSFHDGGRHAEPAAALEAAERMAAEGADIIDVGGCSTRPGSEAVSEEEELRRVGPVLEALRGRVEVPISIDTFSETVARRALALGAEIINDVTGLRGSPGMASLAAESEAAVVIMHMLGSPRDMQHEPIYEDVVQEISDFFRERIAAAREAGVRPDRIILDPGIGFGKRLEHNLEILRRVGDFRALGHPVMIGPSRKSFLGEITGASAEDRLPATAAAVSLAVAAGADILRVHDVAEMRHVADVAHRVRGRGRGRGRAGTPAP